MPHPRYTAEEIVRRGKMLYNESVRAAVEETNHGKYLVINIETGEYEVDEDQLAASERALARRPGAALYGTRIGYQTVGRIGGGVLRLVNKQRQPS
jgi:hypothetical protein